MKMRVFASRNAKEILRDPLNVAFGIGFPLALLLLFSIIQARIPVKLYQIDKITPGIAVFGLSFVALFSATLVSKDRTTSLLMRLFASPLTAFDFISGYVLPLLPMSLAQSAVCFIAAFFFGLPVNANVLLALIVLIPVDIFYIGVGLLAGSVLSDKQVGGICGALLTNLSAWLSGTWFDLSMIGGVFLTIAYALPFAHATDAVKAAVAGDYATILPHLLWVIGYATAMMAFAVWAFKAKMDSEKM
jgi:ABC-2 type transport system permease protein